jgi:hypothetical protein
MGNLQGRWRKGNVEERAGFRRPAVSTFAFKKVRDKIVFGDWTAAMLLSGGLPERRAAAGWFAA